MARRKLKFKKFKKLIDNKIFISIFIIVILQIILMYLLRLPKFDFLSFTKNLFICYALFKTIYKKKYKYLLFIPLLYSLNYILFPSYAGQDILLLPLTVPSYFLGNLQYLQNLDDQQKMFDDAQISLYDEKYNFWYEYMHFIIPEKNIIYYFWINRPGKYDDKLNCHFYKCHLVSGETDNMLQINVPKSAYKKSRECEYRISELKTDEVYYKLKINFKKKKKIIIIKTRNTEIIINGNITSSDNYAGLLVFNHNIPLITKGPKIKSDIGITDTTPIELMNDTFAITDANISIDNTVNKGISWFDIYNGNGYYYMTNYFWTMNYSKNFNIFILFYSDYPYKTSIMVSFIYDKNTNKTIECGNTFINNSLNSMLTGTNGNIELYGTKLHDKNIKYKVKYESPRLKCEIKSLKIVKCLHNFPLYKRLSQNKDYGKGEEIQKVMEELSYHEFGGKSEVKLEYNGKKYAEKSITVIDGVVWDKREKKAPNGYLEKNGSFFESTFYVEHPNRDKLNGKLN